MLFNLFQLLWTTSVKSCSMKLFVASCVKEILLHTDYCRAIPGNKVGFLFVFFASTANHPTGWHKVNLSCNPWPQDPKRLGLARSRTIRMSISDMSPESKHQLAEARSLDSLNPGTFHSAKFAPRHLALLQAIGIGMVCGQFFDHESFALQQAFNHLSWT